MVCEAHGVKRKVCSPPTTLAVGLRRKWASNPIHQAHRNRTKYLFTGILLVGSVQHDGPVVFNPQINTVTRPLFPYISVLVDICAR